MSISWTFDRKKNQYITQVADLPYYMVVYEQEGMKNTVVITCRSVDANKTGNLTYANSIRSAKIQAEEFIETGRWVEFTPEFLTQAVQPKIIAKLVRPTPVVKPKQKSKPAPAPANVSSESLNRLLEHFKKD